MGAGTCQRQEQKRKDPFCPSTACPCQTYRTGLSECVEITGQHYLDTFGLGGGEFGNWMNQNDRQTSLNMGFEALKDLASALKISDKDIAYQGTLAIAFGARGSGNAAAHYEPLRTVINLTKMHGAGSWHMNGGMDLTIILVQRWEQKGCCQNSPTSMRRSKNSLTP